MNLSLSMKKSSKSCQRSLCMVWPLIFKDSTQQTSAGKSSGITFWVRYKRSKTILISHPMWRVISRPLVKVSNNVYFSRIRT